ncbi:MAG: IS110 family transposase, partial [Bacteroidota bacterium]
AARSAKKHNQACKDLYERLRGAGRNYKQAMVAVMHKLIKQVFGVFRSGLHFNNLHYLQFKAQS